MREEREREYKKGREQKKKENPGLGEKPKHDTTSSKLDENISGISKHARHCNNGTINWEEPKIIATFNDKNKKTLQSNLLIRESLEIRKEGTTSGLGLNDPQLCVRSNAWDPLLQKLKDN